MLSTFLYPTFLAILERVPALSTITSDALLSTLYAGLCIGLGLGLVLRVGASTGGMDIPPLIVNKRKHYNLSVSDAVCVSFAFSGDFLSNYN